MSNINFSLEMEVEGLEAIAALIRDLETLPDDPIFRQALLDGALVIEEKAKDNLNKMVYEKPERGYKRTHNLFDSTQATGKIEKGIGAVITGVESRMEYAVYVHEGTGVFARGGNGRKTPWLYRDSHGIFHRTVGQHPKPYLSKACRDSKEEVATLLNNAIIEIGGNH
jgi:HK97 gp10 family phage protein